ncbi:aldose 1-epimerase [Paenibacillus tepidiphilus]|uniref:aldose 1-epimerase n=1 Tax=Paenibacillus tepidiphilus TaxID=2608683 RepID=UPI001239EC7F|nr:aldose 1-epimerase [Paenibacillus tepidiphilus]
MKQVTKGSWNGYDTYILHSQELEVTLLPRLGNNVIALRDLVQERDILRTPAESELEYYMLKPYHFGIPLLIPPGRLRKGRFHYEGADYRFTPNSGDNHIHGLHRTQSWCVSDIEEDEEGCAVVTEFLTQNDPDWMEQFPVPLKLEMTFRLQNASLHQTLKVTHLGEREQPVPFGIGYHSWFHLDGQPERWQLILPAQAVYELDAGLIPSGGLLPLGSLEALHQGMNLQGAILDTILRVGGDQAAEAVMLREDGYGLRYSADSEYFRHWVVYTNGTADRFLCIEPYTWLPDAPNLAKDEDFTGLISLVPGQTVALRTSLELLYPHPEAP